MLNLGRIDTLIDFGSIIEYEIQTQHLSDQLAMADAIADEFNF